MRRLCLSFCRTATTVVAVLLLFALCCAPSFTAGALVDGSLGEHHNRRHNSMPSKMLNNYNNNNGSWVLYAGTITYAGLVSSPANVNNSGGSSGQALLVLCQDCFDLAYGTLVVSLPQGDVVSVQPTCALMQNPVCAVGGGNGTSVAVLNTASSSVSFVDTDCRPTAEAPVAFPSGSSASLTCVNGQATVGTMVNRCSCGGTSCGGQACSQATCVPCGQSNSPLGSIRRNCACGASTCNGQGCSMSRCIPCFNPTWTTVISTVQDRTATTAPAMFGAFSIVIPDAAGTGAFVAASSASVMTVTFVPWVGSAVNITLSAAPVQLLVSGNATFVVAADASLYCLDTVTGAQLWNLTGLPTNGFLIGRLAYSDALGLLLVPAATVIAVSTKSVPGYVAWQSEALYPVTPAVFHPNGAVVLGVDSRGIVALSPFSGKVLWSEQTPITPSPIFAPNSTLHLLNRGTFVVSRRLKYGGTVVVGTAVRIPTPVPPPPKNVSKLIFPNFICSPPTAQIINMTTGCVQDFAVSSQIACSGTGSVVVSSFRNQNCAGTPQRTASFELGQCYTTSTLSFSYIGC